MGPFGPGYLNRLHGILPSLAGQRQFTVLSRNPGSRAGSDLCEVHLSANETP